MLGRKTDPDFVCPQRANRELYWVQGSHSDPGLGRQLWVCCKYTYDGAPGIYCEGVVL